MRTILVAEEMAELDCWLEQRRRRGAHLYDYEIGGVLRMNPAPRRSHGRWQIRVGQLLGPLADARGLCVGGPANLGRDGNFVVPDVVVLRAEDEPGEDDGVWLGRAALAVEVRFPREDEAAKLADYRAVTEAGDLELEEVWYLDADVKELRVYDPRSGRRRPDSALFPLDELVESLFSP